MTIITWLADHAAHRPNKIFCRHFECGRINAPETDAAVTSTLTYAELEARSRDFAHHIQSKLDVTGMVVPIFLPQGIACYFVFLGVMMAGGIPTFMPLPSPKQDAEHYWTSHTDLFERIKPGLIVTNRTALAALSTIFLTIPIMTDADLRADVVRRSEEELPLISGQDIAFLQHSSGTTGLKKGVVFTHEVIERQIKAYVEQLMADENDIVASWLPLYHDMGMIACFILPLALGATIATIDPLVWSSDPRSILKIIEYCRATYCWMPNFAFEHIARMAGKPGSFDLTSLRSLINCSEPCRAETFQRFIESFSTCGIGFDKLACTYAMAETVFAVCHTPAGVPAQVPGFDPTALYDTGMAISSSKPTAMRLLSSGKPIPGVKLSIHDGAGQELKENAIGEIAIEAPFLASGYFRNEHDTLGRFHDGKYFTRDRGFLWNGEVFVLGRIDDVIIAGGRNFHANQIEAIANQVDGVLPGRCAAIAIYSSQAGTHNVVLIAETASSQDKHTIIARSVKQAVFDSMGLMLHKVVLVDSGWIIKTTSGKISRADNLKKYQEQYPDKIDPKTRAVA